MGTRWHEGGPFGVWCGASCGSCSGNRRSLKDLATTAEACDGAPGVRAELYEHSLEDDAMTTTPDSPSPEDDEDKDAVSDPASKQAPGAELGMSPGEGSTFEPEEDPEGHAQ